MIEPTQTKAQSIKREESYLVALVKNQKIAFAAHWVQEILLLQRSQMLKLPFYDRAFLGVVPHQNQIVPLISGRSIFFNEAKKISQTTFTVVRLNELAGEIAGVGVVVDRMVGNLSVEELGSEKLFQLTDISPQVWQLQR